MTIRFLTTQLDTIHILMIIIPYLSLKFYLSRKPVYTITRLYCIISAGNTALHLCIIHKKRDPIRPLLRAGVKLKLGDARNNTLLHLAAERDDTETIKRIANYHISDAENKSIALGLLCLLIISCGNSLKGLID